ncbi:unnamed protein product [Ilex paraguariensis]|uniref:RRM domain-containing protein n=1 Tax=Ilex paraguariensis TaxID=185542 RepID=A0ABC8UHC9_9AQUA
MTYAMTPLLKPYECCCIASVPTPFSITTTKPSFPFFSLPSKPLKLTHLCFSSSSFSSSSPSWVSKPKISQSLLVPLVAQTSDWAHQEEEEVQEDRPVDGFRAVDDTDAGSSLPLQGEGEEEEREEGSVDGGLLEEEEENKDSYAEPPEEAKLFVGNLPYDIDSEKLAQLFNQAGVVEISEVIYNRETDQSRGFGFVTMSTVEEAEKAVEMFHRYTFDRFPGRRYFVRRALSHVVWYSPKKIFLLIYQGQFSWSAKVVVYGFWRIEFAECKSTDSWNLGGGGCGDIFHSHRLILHVDQGLLIELWFRLYNISDLNGRLLTVNKAGPKGSRPERLPQVFEPSVRIYVGNLPWQVDNARLEQVFSEYGKVIDARVLYDRETGRSRGFGFVTMSSETEVHDAIAALDGQDLLVFIRRNRSTNTRVGRKKKQGKKDVKVIS